MSATYRLIELSQKSDMDMTEEQKECYFLSKEAQVEFNCISLNYTPILQDGFNVMLENANGISNRDGWRGRYCVGEILNVHGTWKDTPIFGVDNIGQIANESFRTDPTITGLMVKGEIDEKVGRGWREKARKIIEKSDKKLKHL